MAKLSELQKQSVSSKIDKVLEKPNLLNRSNRLIYYSFKFNNFICSSGDQSRGRMANLHRNFTELFTPDKKFLYMSGADAIRSATLGNYYLMALYLFKPNRINKLKNVYYRQYCERRREEKIPKLKNSLKKLTNS